MSIYLKVFLISLINVFCLCFLIIVMVNSMSDKEQLTHIIKGTYPKRLIILGDITFLAIVETVISLIIWIIKL